MRRGTARKKIGTFDCGAAKASGARPAARRGAIPRHTAQPFFQLRRIRIRGRARFCNRLPKRLRHSPEPVNTSTVMLSSTEIVRRNAIIAGILLLLLSGGVIWWLQSGSNATESKRLTDSAADLIAKGETADAASMLAVAQSIDPANTRASELLATIPPDARIPKESKRKSPFPLPTLPQPSAKKQPLPPTTTVTEGAAAVAEHLRKAREFLDAKNPDAAERELRHSVGRDRSLRSKKAMIEFMLEHRLSEIPGPRAIGYLSDLAAAHGEEFHEPVIAAIRTGTIQPQETSSLLKLLKSHGGVPNEILLLADTTEARLQPERRSALAAACEERLREAPLADRVDGARWLLSLSESKRAANLLSRNEATSSPEAFELWLEIARLNQNFAEALDALAATTNPISPLRAKLHRARILQASGSSGAREEYIETLRLHADDPEAYGEAIAFICSAGNDALMLGSFKKGIDDFPASAHILLAKLTPAARALKDARRVRQILEVASQSNAFNGNVIVRSELAYLNLLLGREEDIEELNRRSVLYPGNAPIRLALAMGLLQKNRAQHALAEVESFLPDIRTVSLRDHEKAILAAVYAANDRKDDAVKVSIGINFGELTAQEIEFAMTSLGRRETPLGPKWQTYFAFYWPHGLAGLAGLAGLVFLYLRFRVFRSRRLTARADRALSQKRFAAAARYASRAVRLQRQNMIAQDIFELANVEMLRIAARKDKDEAEQAADSASPA